MQWHFLGAVQRNKVRALAPLVDVWQGVARFAEGERIARLAAAHASCSRSISAACRVGTGVPPRTPRRWRARSLGSISRCRG